MSTEFYWLAVVLTTIVAVSRITRLLVADKFPPIKALRDRYEESAEGTGWEWLTMCGYCMAPWVCAAVFPLWGHLSGVYADSYPDTTASFVWWIVNGWLAISYLAAILMANDGDKVAA